MAPAVQASAMPFDVRWHTLLEAAEDLPADATLVTPLSGDRLRVTDVQEHRIIVEDLDAGETYPLQRVSCERQKMFTGSSQLSLPVGSLS